jgi:hypothetical protein
MVAMPVRALLAGAAALPGLHTALHLSPPAVRGAGSGRRERGWFAAGDLSQVEAAPQERRVTEAAQLNELALVTAADRTPMCGVAAAVRPRSAVSENLGPRCVFGGAARSEILTEHDSIDS